MQRRTLFAIIAALCALSPVAYLAVRSAVLSPGDANAARDAMTAGESGGLVINSKLAAANNAFGFDLFQQLQRQPASRNIFFSPLSVTLALAMTYNGAAGETKQAMQRALKIEGLNHAELNQSSAELLDELKSSDPKIELAIANSMWARDRVRFNEAFLERNRKFYRAEISTLDFRNPQSVATINRWVNANTKGKINKIVDRIDLQQVMFLINAVYFKGQWRHRFEKTLTQNQPFHLLGGQQKQVPMMSQSGDYLYYRGDKFQAVSLPYGKGGVSLYLFLPDQGSSIDDLLKNLNYQKWEELMKSFRNTPGDVKLPRFKMDYENTLNDSLKALGMEVAFTPRADFSGIREEGNLFISEVKHKAIVEINEEGTEAAAATSVGITVLSGSKRQQRFTFIADRPFLMAIRDSQTGAILFMGMVMEPK